jgi:23S rRNA (pseudouridine1915-N3)-methyltransferase
LRLHIAAIGKLKSGAEKSLADDYQGRIVQLARRAGIAKVTVSEKPESVMPTPTARMADEAAILNAMIPDKAVVIALDERGKTLASTEIARFIQRHVEDGTGDLVFLIGGPDGHHDTMRQRADTMLSFGSMTWPHRLVRIMLLEQVYRALTIMLRHPYHRE